MENPTDGGDVVVAGPRPGGRATRWAFVGFIIAGLIVALAIIGARWGSWFGENAAVYVEPYALVADKVSQSAAIAVKLPKGVTVAEATGKITFSPDINGEWQTVKGSETMLFKPAQKLDIGKYYSATLALAESSITKDFLVDEDPRVIAVLPSSSSTVNESSKITIVFNRPMIPLTALDAQNTDLAKFVSITPVTPGRFKWSTTRNLQFIPEKRLTRSTNYTVKILPGLVSVEGLSVPESPAYTFTTRTLHYASDFGRETLYHNKPLTILFDQPVDLERTKQEIRVWMSGSPADRGAPLQMIPKTPPGTPPLPSVMYPPTGKQVPVTVLYGHRMLYNDDGSSEKTVEDKGILEVYGAQDKFGRPRMWDFSSTYDVLIAKAYPLEGDVILNESRATSFNVPGIVEALTAEAPSSSFVRFDMFDPRGKLWITFGEEIDKDKSDISAPHLAKVAYGEKCAPEQGERYYHGSSDCPKVPDKTRLSLSFEQGSWFNPGDSVKVRLNRLVNTDGVQLTTDAIIEEAKVYPRLAITKTVPAEGATDASPGEIKLCTNTPLDPATEDNFSSRFSVNMPIGLWDWWRPWLVSESAQQRSPCAANEFENTIRVGLAPEHDLKVSLHVIDDFGQKADRDINFRTGKVPETAHNFYHSQKAYNVTSPDRTTLTYSVENLDYVDMQICKVSALQMFRYAGQPRQLDPTEPNSSLPCLTTTEKRIQLPDRYWTRNYFQVKLSDYIEKPLGHYVVSFSNPDHRRVTWEWRSADKGSERVLGPMVYERTFVTVTRMAVVEKHVGWGSSYGSNENDPVVKNALEKEPRSLYWVSQFGSLAPVVGAQVAAYKGKYDYTANGYRDMTLSPAGSGTTGNDGIAKLPAEQSIVGAIVTAGDDSAIVNDYADTMQYVNSAYSSEQLYLYTDRPIYRPGQEVSLKGIYRLGFDANYETMAGKKLQLTVYDPRGTKVKNEEVTLNDYGTFTTSLKLDRNAPLGSYWMNAPGGGGGNFDVEEYVPSPFKVDLVTDKEEYVAGDTARLTLSADYFFGVPLEGGDVEYTVTSQNYYFDRYSDGYFNFGSGWYYSYDGSYGDSYITRGKATIGSDGKAVMLQPLDFSKLFKEDAGKQSKIFVVNVTAKNSNGQAVSAEKSFIVHRASIYAGLSLDKSFVGKGEKVTAKVKTVDTLGKPRQVGGINAEVRKVTWDYYKRREVDGRYYFTSTKKTAVVKKTQLFTNGSGDGSFDFTVDAEGEYEVAIEAKDDASNPAIAVEQLYVYGKGQVAVRPTNNESLDLATDKDKVSVGDNVSIVIKSPYTNAKALVAVERGTIFDYKVIDVKSNLEKYDFTVKESYAPNIYVTVTLLSPRPDIKQGQLRFSVNTARSELGIDISTDKAAYLPGEAVKLKIKTKDWRGRGTPSEVSLAVVDMSVLALKGNPKKNPVQFFYGGMPLTVVSASNIKNVLYEAEVPKGTKGGAGAGVAPNELAKKKRGEFRDTALWRGVVETDAAGNAEITFTLPDNLTTWQAESVGITKDTKVGVGYREFSTKKDIMAVPLQPRFVVPGDEFSVGAQVFNQTKSPATLRVSLESKTLAVGGGKESFITLGPGETNTVYFAAKAPESMTEGRHTFTVSAKNDVYEDTVEGSISITKNETYETVATAGYTTQATTKEYVLVPDFVVPGRGGVTVNAGATLASFVSDALKYLFQFPYGCSEQIASKLSSIAIVKRGLGVKNIGDAFKVPDVEFEGKKYSVDEAVTMGLNRIYQNQVYGGGIAYYKNLRPDYYLTLHVVNALIELKAAGYTIDEDVLTNAAHYVYNELTSRYELNRDKDTVILTAYTLMRLPAYANDEYLRRRVNEIVSDTKYLQDDISSLSLAHLAVIFAGWNSPQKDTVYSYLENRLVVDSRGAHIGQGNGDVFYQYYETPIKDTAWFIKALAADKRENAVTDKALRWLMKSRAKDGAWGSTNNTLAVVEAFTDFLNWKKETESNYHLSFGMDGVEKGSYDFNSTTVLNTFSASVPMKDVAPGVLHKLTLTKEDKNSRSNGLYYDMDLRYYLPAQNIAPRDEGFGIERNFYRVDDKKMKTPVTSAKQGDVLRGHLTITVPAWRNFVTIEDYVPAGVEIVNFRLATADKSLLNGRNNRQQNNYGGYGGIWNAVKSLANVGAQDTSSDDLYAPQTVNESFYPDAEETHDDRLFLFKQQLAPGVYDYDYFIRVLVPGTFSYLPAVASELYRPETFGRTRGDIFKVTR